MWCQNDPRLEIINEFPSLIFSPNMIQKIVLADELNEMAHFHLFHLNAEHLNYAFV